MLVAGYAFSPIDLIPDFVPLWVISTSSILLPGAIYVIFS